MGVLSSSSPPSLQPYESPACSAALPPNDDSDPTVENHSPSPRPLINRKKKKTIDKDARSSSSRSASCSSSIQRGTSLPFKRRVSRVRFGPVRRSKVGDVESIALPLGMSFAAVVAQVLERKDVTMERLSPDYLSVICTSAVRESLANVFGDKFDCFVRNFEKSFGSTLRTLRLINESSKHKEKNLLNSNNVESSTSDETSSGSGCYISSFDIKDSNSEVDLPCIATQNRWNFHEEVQENIQTDSLNQELAIPGQVNQLACVTPSSVLNHSVLGTIEKSVIEQVRSNDLKTLELGLTMEKLKLKERQLALNMDSNHLERSKLAMGISKASFKAEKFKNQLEDTRHTELLKKCIDCLVAGLFIMTFFLIYGAYIYSYKKITDATSSCNPSLEESKSWWIPKPMASFNSGLHTLKCQVQVMSQMMFAFLIILAVAYLIVQRSAISKQTMPVTFIMLLLGIACGLAGKFCVDMLGGNGYFWLVYWEILCLLHFLSNVFTSVLFIILHGPVNVSQAVRERPLLPYWIRRSLFYSIILLILPLLCGLMPFASLSEWKDHFMVLVLDADGGS
ncbi:protein CPR-5 [Herrania umbratica]|uniref:Protein CPR-5 n=1 Tax=Herrania umbratica TaxID=108875 RepID=A0A6J1BPT7_9ROSI|nr:protein CPR-5 [Herrania umbratica]